MNSVTTATRSEVLVLHESPSNAHMQHQPCSEPARAAHRGNHQLTCCGSPCCMPSCMPAAAHCAGLTATMILLDLLLCQALMIGTSLQKYKALFFLSP